MDDSTACGLIGIHRALEQAADIFGLAGTNANVRAVGAIIRIAVRDEDALFSVRLQDLPQRLADASAIGKDEPGSRARCGQVFRDAFFGLPLEFVEPVVEVFLETFAERGEVYVE